MIIGNFTAMQGQEVLSLRRMLSSGYVSDLKGILAKETSDAGPKHFLLVQECSEGRTGNVDIPKACRLYSIADRRVYSRQYTTFARPPFLRSSNNWLMDY